MNILDFNKRLFAILYRVNVNPGKINFPENAAYSLLALLWTIHIMTLGFLVMGILKIKLTSGIFYFFLVGIPGLLILSYFIFLCKRKFEVILKDEKYKKTEWDNLILIAYAVGSLILMFGTAWLFPKIFTH